MFEEVEFLLKEFNALTIEKTKTGSRWHCKLELYCTFNFIQVMLVGLFEPTCCLALLQTHICCFTVPCSNVKNCNFDFLRNSIMNLLLKRQTSDGLRTLGYLETLELF